MPKLSDRDRLADLEARERKAIEEADRARRALRARYAELVRDLAVERLHEREFHDIIAHAIRGGGGAAMTALKALPDAKA